MSFRQNLLQCAIGRRSKTRFPRKKDARLAPVRALALILGASVGMAQTARQATNNLQLLEDVFHQIARRAVDQLEPAKDLPVIVAHRSLEQATAERLLYQELIEILQIEKSRTIFTRPDSLAQAAVINFKILECGLRYRKLPAGWLRSGKIRREAKAVVDFDLQNARTGTIYFQGLVGEVRADTLSSAPVQDLETPGLDFTVGKWEEESPGRKFWEPLLLAAATGAVIYAFYSLRSH
jgi:hypothetical protein